MTYPSPFTIDEEISWASTHDIVFTFFHSRSQRDKFVREIEALCSFSWYTVNRQKERVDGPVSKQWGFMLQLQRKHVAPQILLRLSVNHARARCCCCAANGINLAPVCFMHLQHCEQDAQAASGQHVEDRKCCWRSRFAGKCANKAGSANASYILLTGLLLLRGRKSLWAQTNRGIFLGRASVGINNTCARRICTAVKMTCSPSDVKQYHQIYRLSQWRRKVTSSEQLKANKTRWIHFTAAVHFQNSSQNDRKTHPCVYLH